MKGREKIMTNKIIIQKILLTLLILTLAIPAHASNYVAGDVIVVLKSQNSDGKIKASSFSSDGIGTLRAASFAQTAGAMLTKTFPALSEAKNEIFAVIHSDDANPEELSRELLKNPDVIAASPNYIVRAASTTPNDTRYSDLWGMDFINMPSAWDKETGNSSVYVAILDSGVDWTNPDLTENVASELGYNAINSSMSAIDRMGHGTHVAGTIGAVGNNNLGITGINWRVKMIPVKVLGDNGSGSVDNVISGMNYVASLLSQGYNIKALNLSLATYAKLQPTHDNLVKEPLWRAFKAIDDYNKAVIVVAAGNEAVTVGKPTTRNYYEGGELMYTPGCYVYPASFTGLNNMLSVSASNRGGSIAIYSNTNADIIAPGGDYSRDGSLILSTWPQSSTNSITGEGVSLSGQQGTSMASPHVAGAAALLAAHKPEMTAYQIKTCLLESRNMNYSEGMLDVAAALDYQENYGSTIQDIGTEPEGTEEYNDWKDYNEDPGQNILDILLGGGDDDSSSGCNGFTWGAFAVIMLYPFSKKFMSK